MTSANQKRSRQTEDAQSRRLQRVVSQFRVMRLKERIRKGDQFYHYTHPGRWKTVCENSIYIINHFGGVPQHYKGRFRRRLANNQ